MTHVRERLADALRWALALVAGGLVVFAFAWVLSRPWREARRLGDDVVVLRVLHWGDKREDEIVASLVAEFEALPENRGIRVLRINLGSPAQVATKLQTMMAADDPPDLFYLESERVADLGSKGLLADLDAFIERDAARVASAEAAGAPIDLEDFFPAVLAAFRFDGHQIGRGPLLGLAKDFTTVGFYYNRDLFRRAGISEPPAGGWTWEEFVAAARAIGRLPGCYGADFATWEQMIRICLFTHGVDFASPGFEQFHFDDPRVVAALTQLRDWFDEGRTLLSAKTVAETGQEPFLAGNIGMAGPFGRWKVPLYRDIRAFEWDFAPLPHVAGMPPANGALTVAWAMSSRARHPEASWRLIKYLCGPRGQAKICETGLAIPVLRSLARSPCFRNADVPPSRDEVFLAGAESARPVEWPGDPRYREQLRNGMEQIFKLGAPIEPVLRRVDAEWRSNRPDTALARAYPPMPWRLIALGILIPLALVLIGALVWGWRARPGRLAGREELAGWAMVSPWVLGFVLFTSFPIVLSLLLGFTRWSGMKPLDTAEWVGWDNFRELLLFDQTFRKAIWITAWYALLAVPTGQVAALGAALLMNRDLRGIHAFRAIWYLPSVLAGVGMAVMWKWVFHHEHGLLKLLLDPLLSVVNAAAAIVGWDTAWTTPQWLTRDAETWGVPVFVIVNLWTLGGTMMIYLAGLKGIPPELYEAADIDGAGAWGRFRNVTLPMLSPVIFFNVIMAIIASFQVFTQVFVMTGGGPGTATHFYVFYLYKQAFDLHQMGYASAMSWLLLILVLALTLLVMRGSRRWVYYEGLKG